MTKDRNTSIEMEQQENTLHQNVEMFPTKILFTNSLFLSFSGKNSQT